jgi:hypothetical protein
MDAVCCMLHAACRLSHVACCICHRSKHFPHARAQRASPDAFVGMAVADEAVNVSVAHTPTLNWSRLPHILCTAAAPHPSLQSSVGLQLAHIATAGNAAEKTLLADVTAKNPDASFIELLRLFKARYRMGTRSTHRIWCMLHRVCCVFGAHIASAAQPLFPAIQSVGL